MVEFITMAPTAGDSEYVGAVSKSKGADADRIVGSYGSEGRPATLEYIVSIAKAAEKGGFSTLLLPVGADCLDALVVASVLLAKTEKLKVLLAVRPGFVSPSLFAKQFATLDQWSDGRALFNVVTGGNPAELAADGDFLDHAARYRRTREFIEVLDLYFAGESFDYEGEFYQLKNSKLQIQPKKKPEVYLGGSSPAGKKVAADLSDVYMLWGETLENTKAEIDEVKRLVSETKRDVSYSFSFQVVLGDTEEEAWKNANKLISKADLKAIEAKNNLSKKGEAVGIKRLHALMEDSKGNNFKIGPNLWAGLTQVISGNSIALVGTPEQVSDRIIEYIDLGFDKVLLRGFPHLETTEEVGAKVIPLVKGKLANRKLVNQN